MASSEVLAATAFAPEREKTVFSAEPLFVVRIVERCDPMLSGREELRCDVPPQTLIAAQTLVCLLMRGGRPGEIGEHTYQIPVAGGRQLITLEELR